MIRLEKQAGIKCGGHRGYVAGGGNYIQHAKCDACRGRSPNRQGGDGFSD